MPNNQRHGNLLNGSQPDQRSNKKTYLNLIQKRINLFPYLNYAMKISLEEGGISGTHRVVHPITIISRRNSYLDSLYATIQEILKDAGYRIETLLIPQGSTGSDIQNYVREVRHSVGPVFTDTTVQKACPWFRDRPNPFGTIDRLVAEATYNSLFPDKADMLGMTQESEETTLRGLLELLKLINNQSVIRECRIYAPGLSEHMPFMTRLTDIPVLQNLRRWPPDRRKRKISQTLGPVEQKIAKTIQEAITQIGIPAKIIATLPTTPLPPGHIVITDQHYNAQQRKLVALPLPLASAYGAAWRYGMLGPDHTNRIEEHVRHILRREAKKALAA